MRQPGHSARYEVYDTTGLLALVRAGNADAFGELFVRYQAFAYKVARSASRREAEDLVAEAFRRVYTALSRGHGPSEAFGPYLATTIRSAAAGLAGPHQHVEFGEKHDMSEERPDVDPRVTTAYLSLPESWQNALWYSDVEGLSPRQAAPMLGLPSANAFSALRARARAGLRSAYLLDIVDDACNDEVRDQLTALINNEITPDDLDRVVDEHLESCDRCDAVAARVATVTGGRAGAVIAPAMVAFHGFVATSALIPATAGATGLVGWLRSNTGAAGSSAAGAAGAAAAAAAAVLAVVVGGVMIANRGDDGDVQSSAATTIASPLAEDGGGGAGSGGAAGAGDANDQPPVVVPPDSSSTTSTSSTTTPPSSSSSTTSSAPARRTTPPTTSRSTVVRRPTPVTTVRRTVSSTRPRTTVVATTTSTSAPTTSSSTSTSTTTSSTSTSTTTSSTSSSTTSSTSTSTTTSTSLAPATSSSTSTSAPPSTSTSTSTSVPTPSSSSTSTSTTSVPESTTSTTPPTSSTSTSTSVPESTTSTTPSTSSTSTSSTSTSSTSTSTSTPPSSSSSSTSTTTQPLYRTESMTVGAFKVNGRVYVTVTVRNLSGLGGTVSFSPSVLLPRSTTMECTDSECVLPSGDDVIGSTSTVNLILAENQTKITLTTPMTTKSVIVAG